MVKSCLPDVVKLKMQVYQAKQYLSAARTLIAVTVPYREMVVPIDLTIKGKRLLPFASPSTALMT